MSYGARSNRLKLIDSYVVLFDELIEVDAANSQFSGSAAYNAVVFCERFFHELQLNRPFGELKIDLVANRFDFPAGTVKQW